MPTFHRNLIAARLGLPPARYNVGVERNLRVPMSDGITLRTDHWFPKAKRSFPTILSRSPYYGGTLLRTDPPGLLDPFFAQRFAERGYHFVMQTTRGRYGSKGKFEPLVHEAADGRATLDWIAQQPWFDGNLGMWGGSYVGYTQWAVAQDVPPFLKAIVPTITGSRFSTVAFPDGSLGMLPLQWAYLMELADKHKWTTLVEFVKAHPRTLESVLVPAFDHLPPIEADTVAAGNPISFYRDWVAHSQLDDPYWETIDHASRVPLVTAAAHLITGWHDFFLRETIDDYLALRAAGHEPYLTIGSLSHGMEAVMVSLGMGLDWFDAHLKGDRRRLREKPVRIYVMDANRGAWREIDSWPPPALKVRHFLQADHRLSTADPERESPPDRYRYDPADPTPATVGQPPIAPMGPVDNSALEARPDVLCFTTPPLERDIEVIGPVRLELYVRSSRLHTDFFGRLCDVHPDGRSLNICEGLFRVEPGRGKTQPDGSLRIEVDMWATAKRFQRGHSIRLQVSSGAHPRWYRNLGTGEPIGTGTQMLSAEQTIYHDGAHPSALVLPITAEG